MRTALLALLALSDCQDNSGVRTRFIAVDAMPAPPSVTGSTPPDQGGFGGFGGFGGQLDAGELDGQVVDAGGAAGADAGELDSQVLDAGELDGQVLDAEPLPVDSQVVDAARPPDARVVDAAPPVGDGSERAMSVWRSAQDYPRCERDADCTPDEICARQGEDLLCQLPCGPNLACPETAWCCPPRADLVPQRSFEPFCISDEWANGHSRLNYGCDFTTYPQP